MAKARYLVGTGSEQKLKRNVPKHLVELASKTAWVERIAHLDAKAAKQRSSLFAVKTDAELRRLEDLHARNSSAAINASSILNFDTMRAEQIALSYLRERDQENLRTSAYFLSSDHPDYDELVADAAAGFREALHEASGERRTVDPRAVKLLVEHGVLSQTKADQLNASGWPEELSEHHGFQYFCRLIERADVALANRRYRSWETGALARIDYSEFGSTDGQMVRPRHSPAIASGKTIADLKYAFIERRAASVTRSRAAQYRIPFRVLEERLGANMALNAITREDARAISDFLPRIPSHATQHYKGHTLVDAAAQHEAATGTPANRWDEAQKHLQVVKMAFDFAVNEQWLASNPFGGLKIPIPHESRKKHVVKAATYEPFSISDLNSLFSLPLFVGCVDDENGCHKAGPAILRRHRYWAPIIALWTGMRMNEILQLEKADFGTTASGVTYVRITDQEHGDYAGESFAKRVKSTSAIRDIPLHPVFKSIGFLEWLSEAPDGRLFPEATAGAGEKPSDVYSKRFRSNLKAAGIAKPRRLVFHSFRNNFNDALRSAGVPEEFRKAINGWEKQGSMDRRYGQGHRIDVLFEHVSKIDYPGLVMPAGGKA